MMTNRMMATRWTVRTYWWLTGILACLVAGPPLAACGPYDILAYFWLDRQPGPALERYLQGDLGILVAGHRTEYRYVAYRHLSGLEDGVDNSRALASLWPTPGFESTGDPDSDWTSVRNRVPGVEPLRWLSRSRNREVREGDAVSYEYFFNCLDDALFTAGRTLASRIEQFGEASREVRAWVEAQDQVFANCSKGESIPSPLDDSWDPLSRADRTYQIAAAQFYATRYSTAESLFRAISQDPESPWRDISAYLVARSQIRDGRYGDAANELRNVVETPHLASMHGPARRLLDFATLRSALPERHRQLTERLTVPELEEPLRQTFIDYRWTIGRGAGGDELSQWLRATRRVDDADATRGGSEQTAGQGLIWDLASLLTAAAQTPDVDLLLDAAAGVPDDSPGELTAVYHRSRLLIGLGRLDDAKTILDDLLARPSRLSPADHNRLRFLRAEITPELDNYLHLVAVPPLGLSWDDGTGRPMPWAGNPGSAFPNYRLGQPMLPSTAVELLNHGMTTEEMLRLAEEELLPDPWRRRLALATWTRAATTGNDVIALATAPLLSTLVPELASEMSSYQRATSSDRRFAAAWTLLRFPGLAPVLRWNVGRRTPLAELDTLRDNGWCAGVLAADNIPNQVVRSAEQIATVQASLPAGGLPASANYLGQIVLFRAETHPDDPRLPEALHRVVKATRYGCPMGGYGDVSRAAFQILHQRFPSSSWTKDTPYWYD